MGFCTPVDAWLRGPLRDWSPHLWSVLMFQAWLEHSRTASLARPGALRGEPLAVVARVA